VSDAWPTLRSPISIARSGSEGGPEALEAYLVTKTVSIMT
jgi:hypothetical protein